MYVVAPCRTKKVVYTLESKNFYLKPGPTSLRPYVAHAAGPRHDGSIAPATDIGLPAELVSSTTNTVLLNTTIRITLVWTIFTMLLPGALTFMHCY